MKLPEHGSSMDIRNVGTLPQRYTVSQPEDLDLNLHSRENQTHFHKFLQCFASKSVPFPEQFQFSSHPHNLP